MMVQIVKAADRDLFVSLCFASGHSEKLGNWVLRDCLNQSGFPAAAERVCSSGWNAPRVSLERAAADEFNTTVHEGALARVRY